MYFFSYLSVSIYNKKTGYFRNVSEKPAYIAGRLQISLVFEFIKAISFKIVSVKYSQCWISSKLKKYNM